MLGAVFPAALLFTETGDPIQAAVEAYAQVEAYEVTLKSSSDGGPPQVLRYYFRKPGYVRMEFVTPHGGAVLVYSPVTRQVRLWPFGHRKFPSFTLSPENRLIRSPTGQRVDRSDVGSLYGNVQALQRHGRTTVEGFETLGASEGERISVQAEGGFAVAGTAGYRLWLDRATGFPLRVTSCDAAGKPIETVEFEELKIEPVFPAGFFDP